MGRAGEVIPTRSNDRVSDSYSCKMGSPGCPACGAEPVRGAQFCHHCGRELLPAVTGTTFGDADPKRHPRRWVLAGIVIFAGAVVGALALVNRADDGPASGALVAPASTRLPTTAVSTPTIAPLPASQQTSTAKPTAPPIATVDTAPLPAMEATHLVIASTGALDVLDLRSGHWVRTALRYTPDNLRPLADGVMFSSGSGTIRSITMGGGEPVELMRGGRGRLLGTAAGSVIFVLFNEDLIAGERLIAMAADGSSDWALELRPGVFTRGLTSSGRLVFQASEQISLLQPPRGDFESLGTGEVLAVIGEIVVMWSCTEELECTTTQINTVTRQKAEFESGPARFSDRPDGTVLRIGQDGRGTLFEVVDGLLEPMPGEPRRFPSSDPIPMANDESGVRVDVIGDVIRFTPPGSTGFIDVPAPNGGFAGNVELLLITAAGP